LLKAVDAVLKQNKNPERIKFIEVITQALVEQKKVRVRYQPFGVDEFRNHTIHPHLIKPSIWSDYAQQSDREDRPIQNRSYRIGVPFRRDP